MLTHVGQPDEIRALSEGKIMKRCLLAAAAASAIICASSANAENIAIGIDNAGFPGDLVTATGTDTVLIGAELLNGIEVTATLGNRTIGPNEITGANLFVNNLSSSTETLRLAVGGIDYIGSDSVYKQTATISIAAGSADLAGHYYVDSLNRQMGLDASSVFGVNNNNFDSGLLLGPQSFSFNDTAFSPKSGSPFSMGETLFLTLSPGASLTVDGISMTASAIPEMPTWAMALAGFGLFGLLGLRRQRTQWAAFAN